MTLSSEHWQTKVDIITAAIERKKQEVRELEKRRQAYAAEIKALEK